jgi:hypothetical protein
LRWFGDVSGVGRFGRRTGGRKGEDVPSNPALEVDERRGFTFSNAHIADSCNSVTEFSPRRDNNL